MTITAEQVRILRERTGAGMMECKKALEAAHGDLDIAIENMRKSGLTKADKKVGRVAAEGLVVAKIGPGGKTGVAVEVNCETDFVARGDDFKQFAENVADRAIAAKVDEVAALSALPYDNYGSTTIDQARAALVAKLGENIQIRRVKLFHSDANTLASYVHGGRIGVIVQLKDGDVQLGRDLAMHIAANNPLVIKREEVPADLVAKEKEIFSAQAETSGKPAAIIEKMVEGRVNKFLDEISLVGQPFVKNPEITVGKLLTQSNAQVISFVRFGVGEGIEKQTENFADAVMAQVRGN